ncbi:hypothetical protein [uncultured Selenomonas sp.]|uniref:hypothetical protein n=1 Tax=uncultured Selenomonas sp. TaxID=159275 RepID=UPI00206D8C96|nr:hypothetical protein [uncultured Selenomonas sp.]DAK24528.1 MAG TPA: hypothetical protein [Caudoviricetes sp.]
MPMVVELGETLAGTAIVAGGLGFVMKLYLKPMDNNVVKLTKSVDRLYTSIDMTKEMLQELRVHIQKVEDRAKNNTYHLNMLEKRVTENERRLHLS